MCEFFRSIPGKRTKASLHESAVGEGSRRSGFCDEDGGSEIVMGPNQRKVAACNAAGFFLLPAILSPPAGYCAR